MLIVPLVSCLMLVHSIDSPANIRDEWRQIFGWLDEHLK